MAGRQLLMTFPVTATSHSLAEYRARGGYAALAKALREMKPQDVVKEVAASGLQGRGGASFEVGRKWQVVQYDDGTRGGDEQGYRHGLASSPVPGDERWGANTRPIPSFSRIWSSIRCIWRYPDAVLSS